MFPIVSFIVIHAFGASHMVRLCVGYAHCIVHIFSSS